MKVDTKKSKMPVVIIRLLGELAAKPGTVAFLLKLLPCVLYVQRSQNLGHLLTFPPHASFHSVVHSINNMGGKVPRSPQGQHN